METEAEAVGEASADAAHLMNLMADCVFCSLLFAAVMFDGRMTSVYVAANGVKLFSFAFVVASKTFLSSF